MPHKINTKFKPARCARKISSNISSFIEPVIKITVVPQDRCGVSCWINCAKGSVGTERMRASTGNQGFDAARGVYCDLVEAGIIDPTKVARTALQNAASVAGLMLTTDVLCTEYKEEKHEHIEGATR